MAGKPTYVVDTSSWLAIDAHPDANRILDKLTTLLEQGRICAPPEVLQELKRLSNSVAWVQSHKSDLEKSLRTKLEFFQLVGQVQHAFPAMTGARGRDEKADAYVVATGAYLTANVGQTIVVADETLRRRKNRKIPTACEKFGVECMGIIDMLRAEFPDEEWQDPPARQVSGGGA
ncbi:MAG: DUF4411 family protein [Hyphomonadaceae bacterium]